MPIADVCFLQAGLTGVVFHHRVPSPCFPTAQSSTVSTPPGNPPANSTSPRRAVFEARGITKIYRMGEVEVQALRGVDLDRKSVV